jgi:hypothetical protein
VIDPRKTSFAFLVLLTTGCPMGLGGGTLGISGACSGDLGATAAAQKIESFIRSSNDFAAASTELANSLHDGCRQMGDALEIPRDELGRMSASPDRVRLVCERVSRQMREDLTAIRGAANLRVEAAVVAPHCEVSVDAYARCAGECDVNYTPGTAQIQCEGGELRGSCSASCTGRCAVEVNGACNGTCEGTCSARDAQGNCTGTCAGRCVAQASGTCGGECRGGCSVAFTEPRCTGRVRPPQVNADCRAACDARLDAQATCTPGSAALRVTGDVSTDLAARVQRVQAALAGGYVNVIGLRAKLERVAQSGAELTRAAGELPNAIGAAGAAAATCAVSAGAIAAQAMSSVRVSVDVSVQVSASASVSTQ